MTISEIVLQECSDVVHMLPPKMDENKILKKLEDIGVTTLISQTSWIFVSLSHIPVKFVHSQFLKKWGKVIQWTGLQAYYYYAHILLLKAYWTDTHLKEIVYD